MDMAWCLPIIGILVFNVVILVTQHAVENFDLNMAFIR